MRVLILGGTTEAAQLARLLAGDLRFAPMLSLAGRTAQPALPSIAYRIGGFGGSDGLVRWLMAERIAAIVDATHPFAARISENAVAAAHGSRIPLASIVRAPWTAQAGDRWMLVESAAAAACSLGARPARVFLTIGRRDLAAFKAASMHSYVVRAVDPPSADNLPPTTEVILQRGPFDEAAEEQLLRDRSIEIVVAKNSGGDATYAKIAAARRLGLPVVMIGRPPKPAGVALPDAVAAYAWLVSLVHAHEAAPSERGV